MKKTPTLLHMRRRQNSTLTAERPARQHAKVRDSSVSRMEVNHPLQRAQERCVLCASARLASKTIRWEALTFWCFQKVSAQLEGRGR